MNRPSKLGEAEVARALADLEGWARVGDAITRTYEFKTFPAAIEWVRKVADEAEKLDHHPDLDIRWRKVTATLSTHSAGGLTSLDFVLARTMDGLA